MNFIKKIFDSRTDNSVHLQFQKFSRGEFKNRALIKAKKSGEKYTITTGAEFANELVRKIAEKLGSGKTKVGGALFTTLDIDIDYKEKKRSPQGITRYIIEKEMSGDEIIKLLDKFPKCFFALTFSSGENSIKIKEKAPKSGKPRTKSEEKLSPDFCKLVTNDRTIGESFVFEKPGFKLAEISHNFIIEKIEVPESLKNSKDFAKIREEAKRVGKIIREAEIDGEKIRSEKEFAA